MQNLNFRRLINIQSKEFVTYSQNIYNHVTVKISFFENFGVVFTQAGLRSKHSLTMNSIGGYKRFCFGPLTRISPTSLRMAGPLK